jgi:hypothetical protein
MMGGLKRATQVDFGGLGNLNADVGLVRDWRGQPAVRSLHRRVCVHSGPAFDLAQVQPPDFLSSIPGAMNTEHVDVP